MYKFKINEVEKKLNTNLDKGLTSNEAQNRLDKNGKNELTEKKKQSMLIKFFLEFKDVLIIILMVAAVVSLIIDPREWVESLIIFIVIIINAILGIIQENKAEKSLEALKKMSSPMCKVLRDGKVIPIETIHLVVGDIIMVEAGDFIPADARIIECSHLRVDESALTGESVTVEKISDVIDGIEDKEIALANRKNMLFSSTFVTNGKAKAVVTEVGMKTEIGKIAGMLIGDDNQTTPLQQKLSQVGKVIGIMSIIICVVVFFLEMLTTKGTSDTYLLDAFKTAIALAVAAIPEGLATVVTIILAIGVGNMAKKNAIVKKLPAVETLGSTSIICCDKTGTLTQNKMTVQELYHHTNKKLKNLTEDDKELITYFALCCDAQITNVDGVEKRIGDPTETALIEFNNLYGRPIDKIERVADLPFDSIRKMMTVVVKVNNHYLSITKGAPDIILHHALLSDKEKQEILNANTNMASRALRVLGLGIKAHANKPECNENLEENLTFLGLVGMIDPARPEVKEAIEVASKAGIRTIMITGDHITTASAIAKELNILKDGYRAISSEELQKMSDEELGNQIEDYAVYARVSPEDKVRIVEMWQKKGKVVSMTGDGVNDSPALKKADIGCAMGITGTDVSKEAADMILADDNFTTIVEAVKEGRGIYNNVKKCVKYLLSSNIGEVLTIFLASFIALFGLNLGVPLSPIHLLWINLITDSLPAFGLGMEKASNDEMDKMPRPKTEGFFANKLGYEIALEGILIGVLTLVAYLIGSKQDHIVGQTMAFFTLSSLQLFHSYNIKSEKSIFKQNIFNNKSLNFAFVIGFILQLVVIYTPGLNTNVFGLVALQLKDLLICLGLSFMIVIVMEIAKAFGYKRHNN